VADFTGGTPRPQCKILFSQLPQEFPKVATKGGQAPADCLAGAISVVSINGWSQSLLLLNATFGISWQLPILHDLLK